jgi:hypothetical protein
MTLGSRFWLGTGTENEAELMGFNPSFLITGVVGFFFKKIRSFTFSVTNRLYLLT